MVDVIMYVITMLLGVCAGQAQIKGRPILSVFFVWLRRGKYTKWLMWNIPFTGDDSWYFDIVERDVWGRNK